MMSVDPSCRPKATSNSTKIRISDDSAKLKQLTNISESSNKPNEYFESYEDPEIHRLMVNDKPRTEAYRDAILKNSHLFKGKVVMDVGAGSGILSLFMAAAGAKKVYAVEASRTSSLIIQVARDNGYENIIEVLPLPVEEVELPDNIKVDVIVSEWMGFYLLHESMLLSIIFARDKFLTVGGKLFPSEARIYACPCTLPNLYEEQIDFWDNVYGFNMSAMTSYAMKSKMLKPEVTIVPATDLLAEPVCIKSFMLDYITEADLQEISETKFVGITRAGLYQGLCLWFECDFDGKEYDEDGNCNGTLTTLSTSPFSPATHWKQTVILFGNSSEESVKHFNKHIEYNKMETLEPKRKESGISMVSEEIMDVDKEENNGRQIENHIVKHSHYEVEEDNIVGWKLNLCPSNENKRHYNVTFEILDPEVDEHPIPCQCPMPRCLIITKMIEKDEEQFNEDQNNE